MGQKAVPELCRLSEWKQLYRTTLFDDVIPFWLKHGIDKRYGGISNVITDDGVVISHDKYLWSQGRALWTFSALYNRIERRPEWLAFADRIFQYLRHHGRDNRGRWMYRLDCRGNVVERDISIYVDAFVMNGLAEYYRASKEEEALDMALATYENTLSRLRRPGSYRVAPYIIPPGMKTLAVSMIFSFFYYHLGQIAGRKDICDEAIQRAHEILRDFYVSAKDALLENVPLNGRYVNSPAGRLCVPGHAIEAMWFLISIFEQTGDDLLIRKCCRLIKRHLELAWDAKYGGLRLRLDIEGRPIASFARRGANVKAWWVHVEALVATLYAYLRTRERWCLSWHQRIQDYAYAHFPVETGEWTQWLDRRGRRTRSLALPVKDPFHLPRAMIYLLDLIERINSDLLRSGST